MRAGVLITALLAAGPAVAEPIPVPSGQSVEFIDLIKDAPGTAETTYRFRFLAPGIAREGGAVSIDAAMEDMDALCAEFAIRYLAESGEQPEQVVISLSDRVVEFGYAVPEATQFFEAYRIEDQSCIWEGF